MLQAQVGRQLLRETRQKKVANELDLFALLLNCLFGYRSYLQLVYIHSNSRNLLLCFHLV